MKNGKFNNAVGPQVRAETKKRDKVIPALSALSLGSGLQAATQFFAHDFAYQGALGAHIHHIYPPWGIIGWAGKWFNHYPDAFMRAGSIGITLSSAGLIGLVVAKMVMANSSKASEYLHGSARWASASDIQAAGLIPRARSWWQTVTGRGPAASAGVYVGAWIDSKGRQHYLRHNGPEHVLCYAPTRSGKGVGLVVPTLLSWGHSAVVTALPDALRN